MEKKDQTTKIENRQREEEQHEALAKMRRQYEEAESKKTDDELREEDERMRQRLEADAQLSRAEQFNTKEEMDDNA